MKKHLIILIGGILFGVGLAFGQMTKPEVILNFLTLQDLGLLVLMGLAMIISGTSMIIAKKLGKPIIGGSFAFCKDVIDQRLIIGSIIFGVGWGISGLCPGSSLASLGVGNYPIMFGIIGMFIGAYIHGRFFGK